MATPERQPRPIRPKHGPRIPGVSAIEYDKQYPGFVEIKESTIAGSGAFAAAAIPKGSFLGIYKGERLPYEVVYDEEGKRNSAYYFATGDSKGRFPLSIVDAADLAQSNWTRFMNCADSSKTENVKAYSVADRVEFYAKCNLKPGEELLFYYGREYAKTLGIVFNRKRKRPVTEEEPEDSKK